MVSQSWVVANKKWYVKVESLTKKILWCDKELQKQFAHAVDLIHILYSNFRIHALCYIYWLDASKQSLHCN